MIIQLAGRVLPIRAGACGDAVPGDAQSTDTMFDQVNGEEAKRSIKNPELSDRATANLAARNDPDKVKVRNDKREERYLTSREIVVEQQTANAQPSVYCE